MAALVAAGGFGTTTLRTDTSLEVVWADATTPMRAFTKTADFYAGDCDDVPFPVPAGAAIEGETGLACTQNGDCHLLVIAPHLGKLYEMWRANITGAAQSQFRAGCTAVWDLTRAYGPTLRGKGCSSADAAGFPITAMLANADEVKAGAVNHALRFTLPNPEIRDGIYTPPATHSTGPTAGGPNMPPYGVRLRLKASFNENLVTSTGGKVLVRALKKYGMFLADGGNIPLTLQSDRFTKAKWADVGITNSQALAAITANDFEVVQLGTLTNWKSDTTCYRNP